MPNGRPVKEEVFTRGLDGFADRLGDDLSEQFAGFQVQQVLSGKLYMEIFFDKIPILGDILKEFKFEFGRVSAFISTGVSKVTLEDGSVKTVNPGMTAFIGQKDNIEQINNAIRDLLKWAQRLLVSSSCLLALLVAGANDETLVFTCL